MLEGIRPHKPELSAIQGPRYSGRGTVFNYSEKTKLASPMGKAAHGNPITNN